LLGILLHIGGCGGGDSSGTPAAPTAPTYSISANVSGLTGSGLEVSLNGGTPVSVTSNGVTQLGSGLANATQYSVSVVKSPINPSETCTVTNGAGQINGANVTVDIACAATGTQPTSGSPILFQHIATSTNPAGASWPEGTNFVLHTEALPANATVVLGVTAPHGTSVSISDTLVGSWAAATCTADAGSGNYLATVFVQNVGSAGGADTITINVGSTPVEPVQAVISVFENIATSSAGSGSNCVGHITPSSSGLIDPGSFTPTSNSLGNLIWNYTALCSQQNGTTNPSNWTAASSFSLLNAETIWKTANGFPDASQYYYQATDAAVDPSLTATGENASGNCYNSASVALKVADNGSTAPSSIHVLRIINESFIGFPSPGSLTFDSPTTGNLRVVATPWPDGMPLGPNNIAELTGVSWSDGCAATKLGPINNGSVTWYSANCLPCPACTLTLTFSGSQDVTQSSFRVYDVENAQATQSPTTAGNQTSCNSIATDAPSITPAASSGLAIASIGSNNYQITGLGAGSPSGAVFDLWYYDGETEYDLSTNADGVAHYYLSSDATQNWNWSKVSGTDTCYYLAAIFQ